jgi:preprotein translocase subunit SecA
MIDMVWREHLQHLDHLRQVIGLRGYAQRDPLNEYKTEAFSLFEKLLVDLRQQVTRWVMTVKFQWEPQEFAPPAASQLVEVHLDPTTGENERRGAALGSEGGFLNPEIAAALPASDLPQGWQRTSRNAQCPCGSGRKFKHCHGALV